MPSDVVKSINTPRRTSRVLFTSLLAVGDAIVIFGILVLAYWLYFHTFLQKTFAVITGDKGIPPFMQYLRIYPLATLVLIISFRYYGLYKRQWSLLTSSEFGRIAKATIAGMVSLIILTFVFKQQTVTIIEGKPIPVPITYSTVVWSISIVLVMGFVNVWRKMFGKFEIWYYRRKGLNKRLVLVGTNERAEQVCRGIKSNPQLCYEIVGAISTEKPISRKQVDGVDVIGTLDEFDDIVEQGDIDEVILCVTDLPHEVKANIILKCEREMLDFRLVPDLFEVLTSNVEVVGINGIPLMGLRPLPLESAWNRFIKRAFDLVGSAIGIVISAPIIAIASIFIKASSRGPVFYRQVRCGEDRREFMLYKLRTMKVDAENETGPVMASRDDPRKTNVGKFLRRFNIDELPQLYNVFKGDMSLVGPRPERPYFIHHFKESIPRYMSRHHVKCGITGWAQVNGLIQDTSLEERIKYDLYYMENWSLLFDAQIILKTLLTRKDGY